MKRRGLRRDGGLSIGSHQLTRRLEMSKFTHGSGIGRSTRSRRTGQQRLRKENSWNILTLTEFQGRPDRNGRRKGKNSLLGNGTSQTSVAGAAQSRLHLTMALGHEQRQKAQKADPARSWERPFCSRFRLRLCFLELQNRRSLTHGTSEYL